MNRQDDRPCVAVLPFPRKYRPIRHALLGAAAALGLTSLAAADWTGFRGPGNLGLSDERGLPVTWSDTENVVWKTPLPGPGSSNPVAHGGRVFLTCCTGYGAG